MFRKTWHRTDHCVKFEIDLNQLDKERIICKTATVSDTNSCAMYAQLIEKQNGIRAIKVLIENKEDLTRLSDNMKRSISLNKAAMFQSNLKISSPYLYPFLDMHFGYYK